MMTTDRLWVVIAVWVGLASATVFCAPGAAAFPGPMSEQGTTLCPLRYS